MRARTIALAVILLLPRLAAASGDAASYLTAAHKETALARIDSLRISNCLDAAVTAADPLIEQARAEPDSSFLVQLLVLKGRVLGRMGLEPESEPVLREAISLAEALGDSLSHCRALRQYAAAVGNQGRSDEALVLFGRLLEVARDYGIAVHEGMALLGLSRQHIRRGFADSTLAEARQAVEVFEAAGHPYGQAQALNMVGAAQFRLGIYDDALISFRRMARIGREHDLRVVKIDAENSAGLLAYYLGDPSAALTHLQAAYTMATDPDTIPQSAIAVGSNVAVCLTDLGRFDEADQMFEGLLVLARKGNYGDHLGNIRLDQANMCLKQGRYAEAAQLARAGLAQEERLQIKHRIKARTLIANCLVVRDSADEAIRILYDALPILEMTPEVETEIRLHKELGGVLLRAQRHRDALHHLLRAEQSAARVGQRVSQMDALSQAARAARFLGLEDSALAMLHRATALWDSTRTVPLDPEWREQRGAAGSSIYANLAALLLIHPPGVDSVDRISAAYDAIQPFKARTLMERMLGPGKGAESTTLPRPVTLREVQCEVLRPGELLLDAFLGADEGFLFAITRDTCQVVSLPPHDELEQKLTHYSRIISHPPQERASLNPELLPKISAILSHQLLGEVADLVAGCSRILLSPDGVLNLVPLAALGWPPLEPGAETSSAEQVTLGALREIVRLPSATYLAWQRREPTLEDGLEGNGILAVAAPAGRVDATLHWARTEVQTLADRFRDVDACTIGVDSCSVAELMPRYRVLHFAAHSRVDDQHPWRSSILLYPPGDRENPRADRIAGLHLAARLVALSCCETAGGRVLSGEGVQGLTSAFLSAGVPAVVATLWDVADRSTALLMGSFYAHLADGFTPAAALQAAQHLLRNNEATRQPYFWAGFVLVGDADLRLALTRRSIFERHATATSLLALLLVALATLASIRRRRGRRTQTVDISG